jgi:hypothetical protein
LREGKQAEKYKKGVGLLLGFVVFDKVMHGLDEYCSGL